MPSFKQEKFIATESLDAYGESAERVVWEAIQQGFADKDCIAYWRYPIFSQRGKFRKEPDILIADTELGIIIIEVKSITIDQIVNIQGHRWQYQNYYAHYGNPYQQAENQLFSLLEYFKNEPSLNQKITARVVIALPNITENQWQMRGFDKLPSNPPILFQEQLTSAPIIYHYLQAITPVIKGDKVNEVQWQLLLSMLAGTPVYCQENHRVISTPQSRGKVLQKLRSHLSYFDLEQEKIAKQIPPGCQRIRGIAGSGKTVLLCQKAAIMHLKHPEWKIAFIFFSRSLYSTIIQQIDKWLRYFTHDKIRYNKHQQNLLIFHAWGSAKQQGFYRFLSQLIGLPPLSVNETAIQQPNEALAEACIDLLEKTAIPQVFDAILIDEGQDLIVNTWQYQGKQPFYWLAYQALRASNPVNPELKRLIWAYDEGQSLASFKPLNASEIFGDDLGHLVTGQYASGINKTETMKRCYRTPHSIITVAHGIGMGWLRSQGILVGMMQKAEWEMIGYEVEGNLIPGSQITLKRPLENSPNPLPNWWQGSLITFQHYSTRQQELSVLAEKIKHNLKQDGLRPSREILVIILGQFFDASKLETYVANFLIRQGIDIYLPGTDKCNSLKTNLVSQNPSQFWFEGAVTISRIHRAKGNEADMVYLVGLDNVAKDESNLHLRNQLLIGLTRTRGWVNISGINNYIMYQELKQVIASEGTFSFTFQPPLKRQITATDAGELLEQYALGRRDFQQADLRNAILESINLSDINLIGANLAGASLKQINLDRAKLILADLSHTDLTQASLKRAKLMQANLQNANLTGADLTGADLSDAVLVGTILQDAQLRDTILEDAIGQ